MIYRYVAYRTGVKEDAEDLASDVFVRLLQSNPKVGNLQGWLYRTAENLLTDHYRRRSVRHRVMESTDSLDDFADLNADASKNLRLYDLQQGMKCLTDEQYQVILLKFIEGYSTEEVASVLEKSEGAVKALQFRALQTLRKFFDESHRHG